MHGSNEILSLERNLNPLYDKFLIRIKILGLRNLKSLGLLPVKRPFLKIDLNSIRTKNKKADLQEKKEIICFSKNGGSNPNFLNFLE